MRAFIYWNSHKRCYSARVNGKVAAHAVAILLKDAKFKVSEAGRQKVLAERRKSVHAGIDGEVIALLGVTLVDDIVFPEWCQSCGDVGATLKNEGRRVLYNPYKYASFVTKDGPVEYAERVFISDDGVFIDA